jgi:hypothetical protein
MAGAFASAIKAGHSAFVAGPKIVQETAVPSTAEIGRPFGESPHSRSSLETEILSDEVGIFDRRV